MVSYVRSPGGPRGGAIQARIKKENIDSSYELRIDSDGALPDDPALVIGSVGRWGEESE